MTTNAAANRGRFAWHELLTTNPAGAPDFYKKVVGWTTQQWDGADYTMFVADGAPLAGITKLPEQAVAMGAPPHWLAYTEVPDCDETIEQALSLGGKLLVPAQSVDNVGRFAVMSDPSGATFAFITGANPLPDETEPGPMQFSWHELTTEDLPGAIKFYEALFGWTTVSEYDMGPMGVYRLYGRDKFTYGGMMKRTTDMPPASWLHYIRMSDTADKGAERAQAAGATLILGPMEVPGGDRIAVLIDPQGCAFAVHSK